MTRHEAALVGIYTAHCRRGPRGQIQTILPPERTRFYGYGRQALVDALRRVGVAVGDEVLLPGLICRDVLASLAAVGVVPRFYPVDERLWTDGAALNTVDAPRARAVIAVNYFGFPQPLAAFRAWCRERGAALIEDNAHGFLSADGAVPLGRRGDLGVFSLRKTLLLPNGAALVDNRTHVDVATAQDAKGSIVRAELRYLAKRSVKMLIGLGGIKSVRLFIGCIRFARQAATGDAVPRQDPGGEVLVPGEPFAPLTARLLRRVDLTAERTRRRDLFSLFSALFANVREVRPFVTGLDEGVVPNGFPFLFTGTDPARFIDEWWQRSVQVIRWPDLPLGIRDHAPAHYRNVMLVPFLW